MQAKAEAARTPCRCQEIEELAGILTAISVVSKSLVKRLAALQGNPDAQREKGGKDG